MSDSVRPHRRQPTRLPRPWDSPGKNTGVGCHFLLQCMKVKLKSLSCVRLFATPWTAAYQAPPSTGFSRQEYWSGVPLPSPKMNPRYILKQLYSIEENVLFISSLGSPRTSSVTVLHLWQQKSFFSLLLFSVLFLKILFYLSLTVLSLCCCIGFSLVASSRGFSICGAHTSHCCGFSCCSVHELSSCSSQALKQVVVAHLIVPQHVGPSQPGY